MTLKGGDMVATLYDIVMQKFRGRISSTFFKGMLEEETKQHRDTKFVKANV